MHSLKPWISATNRALALALALCLAGVPQALAQSAPSPSNTQSNQQQPQQQNPNSTLVPDPSKGPLQPVPSQTQPLPNAPGASSAQPQTTVSAPQDQTPHKIEPPLGAAGAEAGNPAGGLASKPAGNAIAPAKQRQVRSMLLKVGAIAAGAAALGIVYGLTRATPSTPPGATTTAGH